MDKHIGKINQEAFGAKDFIINQYIFFQLFNQVKLTLDIYVNF